MSSSSYAVYLRSERSDVDRPRHSASKTLALLVLASSAAREVKPGAIQILTVETWREVKARVRPRALRNGAMLPAASLLPELPYYDLNTCYPPHGQETDAPRRQRELWERATRF